MSETTLASVKKWGSLFILSLAVAIIVIDNTVLNVSIKDIVRDLNTDLKNIQWAITLYPLVVAALTITGGRLGDFLGRKRVFIAGAIIFAIGSIITSFAPNVGVLIFGWSVIEGIGAALMMPATASLLVANFEGKDRAKAFGIWGGIAGAAAAFGPIVGGYLTTNASWNWAFRINIFVVAVLLLGSFLIKESRDTSKKTTFDLVGVGLSSLGLASLVYGIIESTTYGWVTAKKAYDLLGTTYDLGLSVSFWTILLGLVILAGFVAWELWIEKRGKTPLVSMRLFRNRQFNSGTLVTMILALLQSGTIFVLPIFFQAVKGRSAFDTGLALLPLSLAFLVAAPVSGILASKIKPKLLIQGGLIVGAIASVVLYFTLQVEADVWTLAPGQILFGIGFGSIMAQISNLTLSAVKPEQIGEGSGVSSMVRQLGGTLGAAIIGAVFIAALTSSFTSSVNSNPVIPTTAKPTIVQKVESDSASIEFGSNDGSTTPKNKVEQEIETIAHQAVVEGGRQALIYVAAFSFLALLVSFYLPNTMRTHTKTEDVVGH
jgi:EmrB/QacA subfamily drug resistance transporter